MLQIRRELKRVKTDYAGLVVKEEKLLHTLTTNNQPIYITSDQRSYTAASNSVHYARMQKLYANFMQTHGTQMSGASDDKEESDNNQIDVLIDDGTNEDVGNCVLNYFDSSNGLSGMDKPVTVVYTEMATIGPQNWKLPRPLFNLLFKHQREVIRCIFEKDISEWGGCDDPTGFAIFHPMGAGKTLTLITCISMLFRSAEEEDVKMGVLILAPKSMVMQWYDEFMKYNEYSAPFFHQV